MARIVQLIDDWASSARRSPDGIAVVLPHGRTVEIVLAPDQLDDFAVIGFTDIDGIAEDIIDKLRQMPSDCRYLILVDYVMAPSTTPVPVKPSLPGPGSGRWSVTLRDGTRSYYDGGGD